MSAVDNMNDIERNRVAYVQQMEQTVDHLTREYNKYKQLAELWEPRITTEMDPHTQTVKVGLQFGGKYVHATVKFSAIQGVSVEDVVASITDALVESLVVEQIRKVMHPKLESLVKNANSIKGAGTW